MEEGGKLQQTNANYSPQDCRTKGGVRVTWKWLKIDCGRESGLQLLAGTAIGVAVVGAVE